ncbi:MAG: peptide chain release factor N(5)-glutamine methyltransferase [Rhodobacteraceae bacterium]|nr:peptide chain release factor N(5)-glutamine methyltransferase [Paracoccaceae bacterium]
MTPGSVGAALRAGAAQLAAAGVPDPGRDARLLMSAALGIEPGRLTLHGADDLAPQAAETFARMVAERTRFRPVAQILGRRLFWGRDFEVTGDVLDPRPETETLIALALEGARPARILDLGTGSGALLLTLLAEWPEATGLGIDASPAALEVAARNARRLGVAARAELRPGDWCTGLAERFDLIVCNPPYIPAADLEGLDRDVREWEPRMALSPGVTGLESYRTIAAGIGACLAPGGRALFEIGADQGESVPALMREVGFENVRLHLDMGGKARSVEISR